MAFYSDIFTPRVKRETDALPESEVKGQGQCKAILTKLSEWVELRWLMKVSMVSQLVDGQLNHV